MIDLCENYNLWVLNINDDSDLINELQSIKNDESKINDAFYRELEFGTGGLREIIVAGTNRMNIYTVAKASQGLSNYIKHNLRKRKEK